MKSRYSQGYNTEVCLDKGEERTIPVDSPAPRIFTIVLNNLCTSHMVCTSNIELHYLTIKQRYIYTFLLIFISSLCSECSRSTLHCDLKQSLTVLALLYI